MKAVTNLSLLFWNEQTHIASTMGSLTDFCEVMEKVFSGRLSRSWIQFICSNRSGQPMRVMSGANNLGRSF